MDAKLARELESFGGLWKGGYCEGDPLHPLTGSNYGPLGFMSVLHATYLRCIKPYVGPETISLEIGPGRGAWTRALLPSKEVVVLDALSESHNGFYKYIGHAPHVRYHQVHDFECRELADDHFDYMFSFGCLCHVSFDGIVEYATHTFDKMRSGAQCFWMIADYEKYNLALINLETSPFPGGLTVPPHGLTPRTMDEDDEPSPGRWYHAGVERTCWMLQDVGYQIVDPDVGTLLRDPIIHFRKP